MPESLEDLVPSGHLVRSLKEIISSLDLSGVEDLFEDTGGYPYEPKPMLGILLFGLIDGERSSRRIQEHCEFDNRYRYLSDGSVPDDRTICRFRRRLAPVLPELFTQILKLARERGLVKMQVVAVDGTKVAGNVSQWRKILSQADDADSDIADPDCRLMRGPKGFLNGYNAQVAVDAQTGIILTGQVSQNSGDHKELLGVVDSVIQSTGRTPEKIVADKGYESLENAQGLEERGIEPYLHPRGVAEFWNVDGDGRLVCPRGHVPIRRDAFVRHGVRTLRLYVKECPTCPDRDLCSVADYKYLSFPEGLNPSSRIRNSLRCRSPEGRKVLALRGHGVETIFAQMKWNKGFRRFRHKGLSAVNSEFLLECLAHNLKKVVNGHFLRFDRIWSSQRAFIAPQLPTPVARVPTR